MRLYSNRKKIPTIQRPLFFLAKIFLHYIESRRSELSLLEIWEFFFAPKKFQEFSIQTELGKDIYKVIQIATNYGYAYQMGTFAAVRDAYQDLTKKYNLPKQEVKLLWNVSHNSIYKDISDDGEFEFVTRHNSVKVYPGKPTILAGSYDVPSLIGIVPDTLDNEVKNTHDHGIGSIIANQKYLGSLDATTDVSRRYYYERGEDLINYKETPVLDFRIIENFGEYFKNKNVFQPWFYLKPVATLKN